MIIDFTASCCFRSVFSMSVVASAPPPVATAVKMLFVLLPELSKTVALVCSSSKLQNCQTAMQSLSTTLVTQQGTALLQASVQGCQSFSSKWPEAVLWTPALPALHLPFLIPPMIVSPC